MIKTLNKTHKQEILDYCLQNERENFFTISNLISETEAFQKLEIIAKYKDNQISGLLTFFIQHQNLVVHSHSQEIIKELIDEFKNKESIKYVVCYKKYADTITQYLENKYNIVPKQSRIEDVFELTKENFQDYTNPNSDYRKGKGSQKQEIAEFATTINNQPKEKAKPELIKPENEYLLYINNNLIARASLHGKTQNYFQVGGVGTLEPHRRKGYSKEIVSYLCKENLKTHKGLLFTPEDNIAAQTVYARLGFKKFDKLILAKY